MPRPDPRLVERIFEPLCSLAAVATAVILLAYPNGSAEEFQGSLATWSVFAAEFVVVLWACKNRRERLNWLKRSWINSLVLVLTFPVWPTAMQSLRVIRVFRLVALNRLVLVYRRRFFRQPLVTTGLAAFTTILAGAIAFRVVEPNTAPTLGDALWWSMSTVTTVGYGDLYPRTPEGRFVACMVMMFGIAITASFTAGLASMLTVKHEIQEVEHPLQADLTQLRSELATLREILLQRDAPDR